METPPSLIRRMPAAIVALLNMLTSGVRQMAFDFDPCNTALVDDPYPAYKYLQNNGPEN